MKKYLYFKLFLSLSSSLLTLESLRAPENSLNVTESISIEPSPLRAIISEALPFRGKLIDNFEEKKSLKKTYSRLPSEILLSKNTQRKDHDLSLHLSKIDSFSKEFLPTKSNSPTFDLTLSEIPHDPSSLNYLFSSENDRDMLNIDLNPHLNEYPTIKDDSTIFYSADDTIYFSTHSEEENALSEHPANESVLDRQIADNNDSTIFNLTHSKEEKSFDFESFVIFSEDYFLFEEELFASLKAKIFEKLKSWGKIGLKMGVSSGINMGLKFCITKNFENMYNKNIIDIMFILYNTVNDTPAAQIELLLFLGNIGKILLILHFQN